MKKILENIRSEILNSPNIASCLIYPNARYVIADHGSEIIAPAVFLEIASYETGSDPATGELSLVANVEARIVVDSTIEDAEVICQLLACEIANIAHLNSFGCDISPAKVAGITRDFFKPDFDMYVCWLVEWSHELHCGENLWLETGVPPHTITIGAHIDE
jgi:hypothetical protein